MTFLDSVVLAVVEGVTEFLPVSSTAHMILTAYILGISQSFFVTSFEIIIQLGAISGLDIMKNGRTFTANEFLLLLTGFSVSFLVALAVIRFFLYFLHRHSFMVFGFYRIILAAYFFLLFLR